MSGLVVSLVAVGLWLLVASAVVGQPVARARVERFARRHQLPVTATNGAQVIAYLATTRRWRVAGMTGAFVVSLVSAPIDGVRIDSLAVFAGWFVGALVAEARVTHLAVGPRRSASLVPRHVRAYQPLLAWALPIAAGGLSVAVAVVSVVAGNLRSTVDAGPGAVLWCGAALAVLVAIRAMQARIVRRPQPLAPPDLLAADDAIRSRSLLVLSGGGTALILYCVVGQLSAVSVATDLLTVVSLVVVPLVGWSVATARWPVARLSVRRTLGPA